MKLVTARMVGYYFIIVSLIFAIGSISIICFSLLIHNNNIVSTWHFIIVLFLCITCLISAINYMRKLKIGRYLLIFFASLQTLTSLNDIIFTYKIVNKYHFINLFLFFIGILILQHLLSKHSKEWVEKLK
jgi:hypothetical protein